MLLSEILKNRQNENSYKILSERSFDTMALCGTRLDQDFCTFIDQEKYLNDLSPNAVMIITTENISGLLDRKKSGIFVTEDPRKFFFWLHNGLEREASYVRKKEETVIDSTANVSPLSYVSPENVKIGARAIIEPFVTIYPNVVIGNDSVIRAGAKIGGEGFEFKRDSDQVFSVKHLGGVQIGDHVEIQCNTCVDKAVYPWDNTVLEDYVKVDNLVHIAHGVKIARNTMVVAQSGIGGRTIIAPDAWIGFGATVKNGIEIGKNARVSMGAVVTRNVKEGQTVTGNFAVDHGRFLQELRAANERAVQSRGGGGKSS